MAEDLKPQLEELTRQVARVAFALEAEVKTRIASVERFDAPCRCCGCCLVREADTFCPACRTQLRE